MDLKIVFPKNDRELILAKELQRYEMLEIEVKQLSGYDFECLKRLFAMGYTLARPKCEKPMNMAELAVYLEEN